MGVSENRGTPKSSILIRFSIINHPFWGTPILGNIHMLDDFDELVLSQGQREGKVADASIERSRETARGLERSDGCELTSGVFVNFFWNEGPAAI